MAEDKSRFPSNTFTYKDTLSAGGITVRGFYLESDAEGFVEGPKEIADEIAPHGFLPQARPAAAEEAGDPRASKGKK